jgi:uncharacterized protein (TIGR02145 family)
MMTTQAQYLLDQIGTSPSVAFSLRLLKSTYTGPLVRIYVGTSYYDVYPDATTKNFSLSSKISAAIGSSSAAVAVASTNALSSIITAGTTNATVAIWYDQSGNDKYVHTSSTTAAPRIITAGSIRLMNGQPTINFIGAQTSPTPSALISVNTVNYSSQQTATVNAVVQNIGSTSNISGIYSTGISGGWGLNYDQTNGYWLDGNGCNQATTGGPSTTGKIVTGFLNKSNSTSIIYENGVQKGSRTISCTITNGTTDKIAIGIRAENGGNRKFDGNISEVILYPAVLSSTDQTTLESSQSAAYFVPSVTIASSASGAVCAGTSVTFTATTYNFSGTPTYQWYKNSVAINGANSATYSTSSLTSTDVISVSCSDASSIVSDASLSLWLDAANGTTISGNTWSDLSGKGKHATLSSDQSYSSGDGGTIQFNGGQNAVSMPLVSNKTTDITMQTWVYLDANTKGPFFKNGYNNGYVFGTGAGGNGFEVGNKAIMLFAGARWIPTTTNYGYGWKLVTMVINSSGVPSMYINDSLVPGTYTGTSASVPTTGTYLGRNVGDDDANWPKFNGKMGAAYIYTKALTLAEITQNFNATAARYGVSSSNSITSNSITTTISPAPSASITVVGDGCVNKTILSTPTGQTSYLWYKDDAPISGATSNTYSPTTAGDYKVQVTSGSCSTMSAATTIAVCGVTADGRMRSIATPTTLVSQEGGVNFGTGVSEAGATVNATGIGTTLGTVSATTAVVSGVISSTNALTSSIGVIYSTDSNFGTFSTSSTQSNVASGTHVFTLSGLASTTPYYAKSFIVNKAGTSYGAVVSFTTLAVVPTLATTTAASAIAGTTATSGGNVSADGGSAVTARGIVWGTATNPTIALTTKTTDGTGTGVFTSSLTGLTAATLYYVRSYATNAIGTSYGAEISFTTLDVVSTVTSPYTGKVWMDRNLGATQVATGVNDVASYGDLYQWGRAKDGGQLRTAPQVATKLTDISSRSTNSISAQPWTSQANWNSQTGGVWDVKPWNNTDGGVNNPCPTGFRVPSDSEWTAELNGMTGAGLATTTTGVFNSFLKIPQAGVIEGSGFSGTVITTKSVYWTTDRLDGYSSREIRFSPSQNAERNANWYSFRYSVRCIAN